MVQARRKGWFTATHEAFWFAARARHGDQAGTQLLIEVLLLHRRMAHPHVVAGIRTTLEAGSISPDLVAIEARKHAAASGEVCTAPSPRPRRSRTKVVSLPDRRHTTELPADSRPAPSVAAYDELLTHTTNTASNGRVS